MNLAGKVVLFVGGTLFGSAGFDVLKSKDARKVYTHIAAAALRCKDKVMKDVESVQECCSDVLADAKTINNERTAEEEAAYIEDSATAAKGGSKAVKTAAAADKAQKKDTKKAAGTSKTGKKA